MFGVFGSHQVTVKQGSVSGINDKGQVYADHLAMQGPLHRAWGMKRCLALSSRRSTESLVRAVPCRLSQPCNDCVSSEYSHKFAWSVVASQGKGGMGPQGARVVPPRRPVLLLLDRPTRRLSCMQRGVLALAEKRLRLASTLESVLETAGVRMRVCCKSDLCRMWS